ncbi:MAG: hypothetical protein Q4D13_07085 [Erysipelotrichaceae bacterium]|nr:hypothetical protein [Erysipelotrichaceae bacterium]
MTKFEDTMKEMQQNVEELGKYVAEKTKDLQDSDIAAKADELVKKTQEAIDTSMKKINDVIDSVKDDEKLDEFLDKVKAKSQEAVDYTKEKIDGLTREAKASPTIDSLSKDVMAEFEKLKETDVYKNTASFLKDLGNKINDYMEKPEVKETINKAKAKTITIAEAGVEGLKKVLNTDAPAETPAEAPVVEEAPVETPEEPQE